MSRIVIIGSSGFIAQNLIKEIKFQKLSYKSYNLRKKKNILVKNYISFSEKTNWTEYLNDNDIIIFLSSPAHNYFNKKEINIFLKNFNFFLNSISKIKIKKLIFISSVKVIAEDSENKQLDSNTAPAPESLYGKYKLKCEQMILNVSNLNSLNYVILRPPLIIGDGIKGNLLRLIKYIKLQLPIPMKLFQVNRNFISINNLNKIIIKLIQTDEINCTTLTINDGNSYMMSSIIENISKSLNVNIFRINNKFINYMIILLIKPTFIYKKLFSNYVIDCSSDIDKINIKLDNDIEKTINETIINIK